MYSVYLNIYISQHVISSTSQWSLHDNAWYQKLLNEVIFLHNLTFSNLNIDNRGNENNFWDTCMNLFVCCQILWEILSTLQGLIMWLTKISLTFLLILISNINWQEYYCVSRCFWIENLKLQFISNIYIYCFHSKCKVCASQLSFYIEKKNQNFNDGMVHWISWLQGNHYRCWLGDLPSSECLSAADVTIHVNFLGEETPVVKPVYPLAPPPPVAPVWLRENLLYWCDLRIL